MKNLLFINGHMNPGGTEKSLLDILCHLDYSQYTVELLLLEEFGDYVSEIPSDVQVRLFDLHNTYGSFINSIKRCLQKRDLKSLWVRFVFLCMRFLGIDKLKWASKTIVGKKKYDCVIAFRPGIATELAAYAVNAEKKITWWHHGEINLSEYQQKEYEVECLKMDYVVAVSKGSAELLENRFPSLKNKITVIPNMVDNRRILKKSKAYVPFEKQDGVYDIVTVGRLSPEKHIENVISAAISLVSKRKNFRWFVVGDGEQRAELEQQVQKNNLTDKVFFVGSKENPYPYIADADIFVHPSYVESQGLTVLEALVLEKMSVVTRSSGIQEFITDGKNAFIAEQSIDSLVEKVELVLSHDKEALLDLQCQRETVERFSPECIMNRFMRLIEE